MITVTLQLRSGKAPARRPDAWFVPGGDVAGWLREIATWDVPQAAVRLLPVPRSHSDRAACGVMALVEGAATPVASSRCVPFARVGERLFVPVDAWFDPDVSDSELRELLVEQREYVWHPAVGLVALDPSEVLRIADLIAIGPPLARLWDAAQPGVALARRLVSLMPEQSISFEQMLEEGRGDIGSEQPEADNLPPSPREPQPGVGGAIARHGTRLVANVVQWLAQHVPGTANSPTWVNNLEEWARRKLAGIYDGLDAQRNKEITRLLNLLESDPDRGLRFALPMGGEAHRGLAPPSNRLGERDVDYRSGGRGGPADYWDLSAQHRQELLTRYRELANREINLGRHRRAAYIYAELLGDHNAAASALEAGRHWREAAALYQQKLKRPLEAARCLEQGGQWNEAIALYQELHEHEKAGDLYVQIEQREAADAEYRQAADNHHARGDHLSAARLYEDKLRSPDEAVDELASGWPASSQAGHCLRGVFALLGKLGRHHTAQRWVARLGEEGPPLRLVASTAEILADTATRYPDRTTSLAAADCTRRLVSRQLTDAAPADARQLLTSLGKLAPEDRLLTRDCQRFLARMAPKPATRRPKVEDVKRPRLVRVITLPTDVDWKAATCSGDTMFMAGHDGRQMCRVFRCGWDGVVDPTSLGWSVTHSSANTSMILTMTWLRDSLLMAHVVGHEPLRRMTFAASDHFPDVYEAGSAQLATIFTFGACRASHGVTWRLDTNENYEGLSLVAIDRDGQIASTWDIMIPLRMGETMEHPIPIHARSGRVYVGLFDELRILDAHGQSQTALFSQRITAVSGSAPNTRTRIVVTFPHGAAIFWDDVEGQRTQEIAEDRTDPVAGFNRGGYLVVADAQGCEIYGTSGRHAKLERTLTGFSSKPIAILSAPRTDQFGIAFENGQIHVYEMP